MNPDRVDDALVDDYLSLAADREAAVEVLRQIYTNDSGPLPFPAAEALPESMPMLVVWGDKDNLAPSTGPVGVSARARRPRRGDALRGAQQRGPCATGRRPARTNAILEEWLGVSRSVLSAYLCCGMSSSECHCHPVFIHDASRRRHEGAGPVPPERRMPAKVSA